MKTRLATSDDLQDLFEWRNDRHSQDMSFHQGPVCPAEHRSWFEGALLNPARLLVIGIDGRRKAGVARYDLAGRTAQVSINLNPACRGRGLSHRLLIASEALIPRHWTLEALDALIKTENVASFRAFERAGYLRQEACRKSASQAFVYRKAFLRADV